MTPMLCSMRAAASVVSAERFSAKDASSALTAARYATRPFSLASGSTGVSTDATGGTFGRSTATTTGRGDDQGHAGLFARIPTTSAIAAAMATSDALPIMALR